MAGEPAYLPVLTKVVFVALRLGRLVYPAVHIILEGSGVIVPRSSSHQLQTPLERPVGQHHAGSIAGKAVCVVFVGGMVARKSCSLAPLITDLIISGSYVSVVIYSENSVGLVGCCCFVSRLMLLFRVSSIY